MKYENAQATLLGDRKTNQDRCLLMQSPDAFLLALADGMGGHPRGEMAAQILMDTSRKTFLTSRKPISNPRVFLSGLMDITHQQIITYGNQQTPPIEPRTTGVLCLIQENHAHWAHIGDSRLYIMRNGIIALRTDDHSYVEQLRQQGIISAAQVHTHRFRNYVTRCLGGQNNRPVAELGGPFPLEEGDTILLCSDGFWSALPERTLVDSLYKNTTPLASVISALAAQAENNSKPESDNVTAIAIRWRKMSQNIQPADNRVSLTDNAASQERPRGSESEVQEAIDNLRTLVDESDSKE